MKRTLLALCSGLAATATAGTTYADAPYGYVSSDSALREGTFYYNDFNKYTVFNDYGSTTYVTAGTALVGNSRGTYKMVNSTGSLTIANGYGTTSAPGNSDTLTANSIYDPTRSGPINGNVKSDNTDTIGDNTFTVGGGVLNFSKGSKWTGTTSRGVQFDISTVGYTDITVSFDFAQPTNGDSGYYLFRASADGGATWAYSTVIDLVTTDTTTATWYSDFSFDLGAYTSLDNNASFVFQMVATPSPTTGTFVDVDGNAITDSGAGAFSLDRITLSGTAIPEPATTAALLGLVVSVVACRHRRRAD